VGKGLLIAADSLIYMVTALLMRNEAESAVFFLPL